MRESATLIGHVESVKGGMVSIRLRDDIPTYMMVDGRSYRVAQVGAFLRVPIGYTHLYMVCALVGAAAAPLTEAPRATHRWLSAALFGEALGGIFERGISQYPTIDDEVHLVTPDDMRTIYGSLDSQRSITVGQIAASSGIPGDLDLGKLVSRHSLVVGSTGSGKSNFVAVLLQAIGAEGFQSARVLVVDPHGEYSSAVGPLARVFKVQPDEIMGEYPLRVPFWALPFDELRAAVLGDMQPSSEAAVRDAVAELKQEASSQLNQPPPVSAVTGDSPIPFSLRRLWFELDDFERRTFQDSALTQPCMPIQEGSAESLTSNHYPPPSPGSSAPWANQRKRNLGKQLELLRSRLLDSRFDFMLNPGVGLTPTVDGEIQGDLDSVVSSWIGHDRALTVLDVSGLPVEVLPLVVGTVVRVVYDLLFWASGLPVGGRMQPLLLVLEEAHLFLPDGRDSLAHRTIGRVAKEGRKYGVGLCLVSQRPVEIDSGILSQCGTMVALRLSNGADRARVQAAMPDDLGSLVDLLPALRTGEGIVLGEAMPIPSRIQFFASRYQMVGDDPDIATCWSAVRPEPDHYVTALRNWRWQNT